MFIDRNGKNIFLWFSLFFGLNLIFGVQSINILGIVTSISKAHSIFMTSILSEFANSGHSVTLFSPYPHSKIFNHISFDDLLETNKVYDRWYNKTRSRSSGKYEEGLRHINKIINHESFQKLLKSNLNIDVIVLDYDYNEALLGLGEIFNCPIVVLSTGQLKPTLLRLLGLPYPFYNLYAIETNIETSGIFTKIGNYFRNFYNQFVLDYHYYNDQNIFYDTAFPKAVIPFDAAIKNSVAKIFTTSIARTSSISHKDLIDITGIHVRDKSFLGYTFDEELHQFIHSADHGCIYVFLGLDLNSEGFLKDKINTVFRALYRRPEKVIWSWNGNSSAIKKSDQFYFKNWLPQVHILRHRNIKLIISNGGHLSLLEAIKYEKPILGISLNHEDSTELDEISSQGLGIKIAFDNITENSILWSITELSSNERYIDNLSLKSQYLEFGYGPVAPMKTLSYWLRHLSRYRNEFKIQSSQLSTFDFYLLDNYLIALMTLVTACVSTIISGFVLWKLFSRTFVQRKPKLY